LKGTITPVRATSTFGLGFKFHIHYDLQIGIGFNFELSRLEFRYAYIRTLLPMHFGKFTYTVLPFPTDHTSVSSALVKLVFDA